MASEGILNEEKRNLMIENGINSDNATSQKKMESVIIVESINYLSIERLKLLLTSLNSNERKLKILRNSSAIKGFNCMEIEKLTLLLNICINDCRLNDLIKLLENYENVNAVDFGKFELIYKGCLRGWRLLSKRYFVDIINTIDDERLEFILHLRINPKLSLMEILQNQNMLARFKSIDLKRFKLFSSNPKHSIFVTMMFPIMLQHGNVNAINQLDIEKFSLILDCEDIDDNAKWKWLVNLDNTGADAINDIDMEKFKLLLNVDTVNGNGYEANRREFTYDFNRLYVEDNIKLLADRSFVDNINLFDIEKFKLILAASYGDLMMSLLKNGNIINSMNIQRLSFLLRTHKIPRNCKIDLFKNDGVVATIDTIDVEKLKFYLGIEMMTMEDEDIDVDDGSGVSETDNGGNDLLLFTFYMHFEDKCLPERSYDSDYSDLDELSYLPRPVHIGCDKMDAHLIGQPSFANSLNLIEIRRFKLLSLKYLEMMKRILKNQNTTAAVNSLDFGKLKTATKYMREHNLFYFFEAIRMDTRINFNLAMSLCRIGLIRNVTYDYLLDNKALYAEIKKIFPKRIPVDQILVESAINEGNVLNLKYLCLSFIIENYDESVKQVGVHDPKKSFNFLPNL